MVNLDTAKKSASKPINNWHRADIICALKKSGWSLRQLSLHNGYSECAARVCLHTPWPKMERIIAAAIGGVTPKDIWPSRYDEDGRPNRKRGRPASRHNRINASLPPNQQRAM